MPKRFSGTMFASLTRRLATVIAAVTVALAIGTHGGVTSTAQASSLSQEDLNAVNAINAYFNSFRYLHGEFVQVGPQGHISRGEFYMSKPGRLRFEYKPPNPYLVVADGRYVYINNKETDRSDVYPLSQTPLEIVLAERVDLLENANILEVIHRDDLVAITVEDKRTLVPGKLTLVFDRSRESLEQWIILDGSGNRTTISLTGLTSEVKPDPALFRFTVNREIQVDRFGR